MFTLAQGLFAPLLSIAGTVAVSLEWPNYPERGQNFSLRWSAGTPPVSSRVIHVQYIARFRSIDHLLSRKYVVYVLESNVWTGLSVSFNEPD